MAVRVRAADPFKVLYQLPADTNIVICIGGRGGLKTYEVSKFVAFSATIRRKRCAVLRDEKETIRESILNEVLLRYDTANRNGALEGKFERLGIGIKDRETDEMLVFTKGFRASSGAKTANLKSISNVDIAVVEEAEDIRDEDKFNTFADSIRKEGSLIIIVLNTPDVGHWIVKRYFNTIAEGDGFFRLEPKTLPGFLCIQTDYTMNPYLPKHIVDKYRGYGDPANHLYNPFYYKTAILGLASTGRKGQILKKVKPIKLADYLKLPHREIFGQDFGTASPAGLVGVKIDKNRCYVRQLNYEPLNTLDIAKLYCRLKFGPSDRIIADSADPKAIHRLKNGYKGEDLAAKEFEVYPQLARGFHVVPARKGADSVTFGLDILDGMELFAVEESKDLWTEIQSYVYDQDKNGNYTNEPIDDFNHLIDPLRYVVLDQKQSARTGSTAGGRG